MNSFRSLEQEREAILDRMQMRREAYRRVLADGEDFRKITASRGDGHAQTDVHASSRPGPDHDAARSVPDATVYTYSRAPSHFPRTTVMRVVRDHPLLCALGVATVLAIGPRRIARSVVTGGAALGAVSGNPSNVDAIGRLLSLASAYAQRKAR